MATQTRVGTAGTTVPALGAERAGDLAEADARASGERA